MTRARKTPIFPHSRRKTPRVPDKVQRFVEEYLVDLNGSQAAIRAGYSEKSASYQARDLLARADVSALVAEAMAERSRRTGITVDKVLEKWWAIATADPSEICEVRRTCCRYCYGKNNRYQRTPREYEEAQEEFTNKQVAAKALGSSIPAKFDPQGGIGWDSRKDPNPKCPECFGEGVMAAFFKDTRDMSPAARQLYAGVKRSKDGMQVLTQSQENALKLVASHLGMFTTKVLHGEDKDNPFPSGGIIVIPAKTAPGSDDPVL